MLQPGGELVWFRLGVGALELAGMGIWDAPVLTCVGWLCVLQPSTAAAEPAQCPHHSVSPSLSRLVLSPMAPWPCAVSLQGGHTCLIGPDLNLAGLTGLLHLTPNPGLPCPACRRPSAPMRTSHSLSS